MPSVFASIGGTLVNPEYFLDQYAGEMEICGWLEGG
jgi:hypothetical protein